MTVIMSQMITLVEEHTAAVTGRKVRFDARTLERNPNLIMNALRWKKEGKSRPRGG